ncbi:MAG: hypothetical protein IJA33_02050 [Oscillospiraceae bacterium]|nr:hypothetical protein [Oscillospiraceae bacterium]
MKKEIENLTLRALIGVAAALLIVGAMGLITEAQMNRTFIEQASGLKGGEVVMTVDGESVTAEEYLYTTAYAAQSLSYYGITDLNAELGEGMTAADFVAQQAKEQVVASAALRAWAEEKDVQLSSEDRIALHEQKEAYGGEAAFQQTLKMVGVTEELFDSLMTQDMLYNHLYEIYCGKDGAQRPSEADLEILAGEHKLVSAYVLVMDAAAEGAKEKMEDYAARLAEAENKEEQFTAFAAELQCDSAVQTFDCCHSSPVNDALMELEVNGVSGVVEAEGALYVLVRAELDLDTVAYVNFSEAYNLRVSEAVVEEKESVMSKIDVADFYAKYTQLQQNAMASMAQG